MNLYEYQAIQLFSAYKIPVLTGRVVTTASEAVDAFRLLGAPCVLKAQVHSGGRGKAGGIRFVSAEEEVIRETQAMLGHRLVTTQTGPGGLVVRLAYIRQAVPIDHEYYLSLSVDGQSGRVMLLASRAGGVDIEQTARQDPDAIIREPIDCTIGPRSYQLRYAAKELGLNPETTRHFASLVSNLYRLFVDHDCSLIEINPLALTDAGDLLALDARITLDDNALYRQPDMSALRDDSDVDARIQKAEHLGLSYIPLEGNIGCMVNGAGLAMATLDLLDHAGGKPANFLDIGGGVSEEKVTDAFRLLLSDKQVKCLLINIFGGIVQCDLVARGIVQATRSIAITVPIVVRLNGTHAKEGRHILSQSGLQIIPVDTLSQMVQKAVSLAKEVSQ